MTNNYFELSESDRTRKIGEIVGAFPSEDTEQARKDISKIVDDYQAFDKGVIWLLDQAVSAGKFEEVVEELRDYEKRELCYKPPQQRALDPMPRHRTQDLFGGLCQQIGIEPTEEVTHYVGGF